MMGQRPQKGAKGTFEAKKKGSDDKSKEPNESQSRVAKEEIDSDKRGVQEEGYNG